jgi:hypothetical protein
MHSVTEEPEQSIFLDPGRVRQKAFKEFSRHRGSVCVDMDCLITGEGSLAYKMDFSLRWWNCTGFLRFRLAPAPIRPPINTVFSVIAQVPTA